MTGPDYLDLPPHLDARAQRWRRVARFGEAVVNDMEARVDAMALIPGGLSRENVLSLMEGMYSRGLGEVLAEETMPVTDPAYARWAEVSGRVLDSTMDPEMLEVIRVASMAMSELHDQVARLEREKAS